MKDTLITAHRKKVELLTWLVCFVMANLLNLYAIIAYKTSFLEVLTSFFLRHYVFVRALCNMECITSRHLRSANLSCIPQK